MGAIINQLQDETDAQELRNLADLMPSYRRYCSHHFRNSAAAILNSAEILERSGLGGESLNALTRIKVAITHMVDDMAKAGI